MAAAEAGGDELRAMEMALGINEHAGRTFAAQTGKPAAGGGFRRYRTPDARHPIPAGYIVCVGRGEGSDSPRTFSIVARAAAPVSSSVNWTPMLCLQLPCIPSGVQRGAVANVERQYAARFGFCHPLPE
jgi:hypothetical protein